MTQEQYNILLQYKNALKNFCNEYKSFYIPEAQSLPELQNNHLDKRIKMSEIFTPLSVVSLEDYIKRKTISDYPDNSLIMETDQALYGFTIFALKHSPDILLEAREIDIYLEFITETDRTLLPNSHTGGRGIYLIQYRDSMWSSQIKEMIVALPPYAEKKYVPKNSYRIKGMYVKEKELEYFLLEPSVKNQKEDTPLTTRKLKEIGTISSKNILSSPDILQTSNLQIQSGNRLSTRTLKKSTKIPGKIILSTPGGGKTTYLQMVTFAYLDNPIFDNSLPQDEICTKMRECLNINDNRFPVFIRIRDFSEELPSRFATFPNIEDIIMWSIESYNTLGTLTPDNRQFLNNFIKKNDIILLIDGIDEFNNSTNQKYFIEKLKEYLLHNNLSCKVYISARYGNYINSELRFLLSPLNIDEFIIEELSGNYNIIKNFATNWYKCVFKYNISKQKNLDKSFLIPIKNDANLSKLITNPLELTNLLIVSSNGEYLPSDINQTYAKAINLQLNWNQNSKYDSIDVLYQLAYLAFQMSISTTDNILISENKLIEVISQARIDLKRFFRSSLSSDEKEIRDFINYILFNTCILQENTSATNKRNEVQYEFYHLQYQAFLTAYCISRNLFSKENRKTNKFEYLKQHLSVENDFWNQITLLAALQDIGLQLDIIEYLLSRAIDNPKENKFLSLLLQLVSVPRINCDQEEKLLVAELLVKNPTRLNLLIRNKENIQWILLNNTAIENKNFITKLLSPVEEFIKQIKLIEKIEPTDKNKKEQLETECEKYLAPMRPLLFYTIWNGQLATDEIKYTLNIGFKNWINLETISLIRDSLLRNQNKQQIITILDEMYKESFSQNESNYTLLLATIKFLSQTELSPFELSYNMLKCNDPMEQVIGVNILLLASWLTYLNKYSLFGVINKDNPNEAMLKDIQPIICNNIIKDNFTSKDYEVAFCDMVQAGFLNNTTTEWFTQELFEFEVTKLLEAEKIEIDSRSFDLVSSFPITEKTLAFKLKINIPSKKTMELQELYKEKDIITKIRLFKIISLLHIWDQYQLAVKFALLKSSADNQINIIKKKDFQIFWNDLNAQMDALSILADYDTNQAMTFTVTDDTGKETTCEVIFTFTSDETNLDYIVYTDNSIDEEGNTKVYASRYSETDSGIKLLPIESEKEWAVIETILEDLQKDLLDE